MKKVLIIGATGMLGHVLLQRWQGRFEVAGTLRQSESYGFLQGMKLYEGVEAEKPESVAKALEDFRPEVVVNCVGVIKQRDDAKNAEPSIQVNALFPHQLARLCGERGTRLIHLSTDCVFSGDKGQPYREEDVADARDIYGLSKYMGEVDYPHALTLRTSIIGHEVKEKRSLVEWVVSQKGNKVNGFAHALYTGFTTLEMADVMAMVIERFPELRGVYHLSADEISKYELVRLINSALCLDMTVEKDESFRCDRRLDSRRFRDVTGYRPPAWTEMIQRMAEEAIRHD